MRAARKRKRRGRKQEEHKKMQEASRKIDELAEKLGDWDGVAIIRKFRDNNLRRDRQR